MLKTRGDAGAGRGGPFRAADKRERYLHAAPDACRTHEGARQGTEPGLATAYHGARAAPEAQRFRRELPTQVSRCRLEGEERADGRSAVLSHAQRASEKGVEERAARCGPGDSQIKLSEKQAKAIVIHWVPRSQLRRAVDDACSEYEGAPKLATAKFGRKGEMLADANSQGAGKPRCC